jgi:transcriptional regulator with GAF, ATPase, and Fis domain
LSELLPEVWWHAAPSARDSATAAVAALAASGIAAHERRDPDEGGPGILFLDSVHRDACEQLRGLSRNGLERVLVVWLGGEPLSGRNSWMLLRAGAADVLGWLHRSALADEVGARLHRWHAVERLVNAPLVAHNLIGSSPVWLDLLRNVVEIATFTQAAVLITGESGTGKELIARLIHSLDIRARKRSLVVLDCTTVVPELAGSEFFGHERGSYTGATGPRDGAFALADGGTLFLDEVGELRPTMQAQLLRVVQEGTYKRVGGNSWSETHFRLVCATNRELGQEITAGRFRADLYYRIAAVTLRVPALRERPDDVLPLFRHFFQELRPEREPPELEPPVREHLLRRDFPGNVRDLKQLAARVAYRHVGPGPITVGDLPEDERDRAGDAAATASIDPGSWHDLAFDSSIRRALLQGVGLREIGRVASETAIQIALGDASGNLRQAARRLGITDRALQMRRAARKVPVPGIVG